MEDGMNVTHLDAFNDGYEVALSSIQDFVERLDASGEGAAEKYDKVKSMVAGMVALVVSRRAPRQESSIILPNQ